MQKKIGLALFDLDGDVSETTNVADQHPELVAKVAKFMDDSHVPDPRWQASSKL